MIAHHAFLFFFTVVVDKREGNVGDVIMLSITVQVHQLILARLVHPSPDNRLSFSYTVSS